MKIGMRKPSLKKSFKAKTTGRAKRTIKSSINPLYGKKGMGLVNNPRKAVYNKVYNKTTVSVMPKSPNRKSNSNTNSEYTTSSNKLAVIWAISFIIILFNGKPLLSKLTSFIIVVFLSKIIASIFNTKLKGDKFNNTDEPSNKSNIDNNIYDDEVNLYLKQINESINIINTTKNPHTFFSRYDLLIERLNHLIDISSKVNYSGENPANYLREIQEGKASSLNDFVDRYYEEVLLKITNLKTEKAKISNAIKFFENLMQYEEQLQTENIDYIDKLYIKLKDNINK